MFTESLVYQNQDSLLTFIASHGLADKAHMFVQVFFPPAYLRNQIEAVMQEITQVLPKASIAGCTAAYSFSAGKKENFEGHVLLVFHSFESTDMRTKLVDLSHNAVSSFSEMVKEAASAISTPGTKGFLVLSTNPDIDGEKVISAIESVSPQKTEIFGSVAAASNQDQHGFVCNEEALTDEGLLLCSFSSEILQIHHLSSSNWSPIGKKFQVTRCNGRELVELDHREAKQIIMAHLGIQDATNLLDISWLYPLMHINEKGQCYTYTYHTRTDSGSLFMNSELPVGSFVQLSYENLTDVLQGIQQGYDKLRGIDTESVMLVACVSRYMLLDDLNWQLIWGYGGRVPITGMFGWGEFSKIDGTNMFSSEMLDIISFSEHTEKPFSYDFIKDEISLDKRKYDMVLHHLIMYSAREMQDINDRLELSIEDKTSQLRENYYRDLVSGFPNKNRLLRDIALKKVDKVAYIVLPLLQRYASYYGLELIRRLERAFGSFTKFCFEKENGYFYQISSESYAIGCSNRISFHDFVSKLQWYLELLKKHIFSIGGADIYLDATLGIADSNSDNICENANTALVIAINEHRQYVIYDPDSVSVTKMKANMEMVSKIRSAIEEDRIFPVFQPIYDNSKHTITKYEALARMEDTDGSIIPPLSFIEVAKLSGQYSAITTVMMKKAFEFFKESKYEFSLNLSISDIKNAESNAAILSRLSSFPKPQHVVFEILETEKIEEFEEVQQFISRVKQLGGHIALDDFGNGYSNMMYLTRLDIDYIKLDGSIVKDAATDKVAENAVKTMLNFVKITGQKVIAEYVSDQAIQQKIQELGVDYSQGYYIGRPAKMLLPDDFSLA